MLQSLQKDICLAKHFVQMRKQSAGASINIALFIEATQTVFAYI